MATDKKLQRISEARSELIAIYEARPVGLLTQASLLASAEGQKVQQLREIIDRYSESARPKGARGGQRRGISDEIAKELRKRIDEDMRATGFSSAKAFLAARVPATVKPQNGMNREEYVELLYRYYKRGGLRRSGSIKPAKSV